jgi:hypothetical protein
LCLWRILHHYRFIFRIWCYEANLVSSFIKGIQIIFIRNNNIQKTRNYIKTAHFSYIFNQIVSILFLILQDCF